MTKFAAYIIIFLFFTVICLPALLVSTGPREQERDSISPLTSGEFKAVPDDILINVWNHKAGKLEEMPLEQYVVGVTAAEMPASFEEEALKAQAVIARTYVLSKVRDRGGSGCDRHAHADICTDPAHCQAWVGEREAKEKWVFYQEAFYWNKIVSAVRDTKDIIIIYQDEPVEAFFHSTCGGHTDSSEEVWSTALPYLKGVTCSYCGHSPWTEKKYTYTLQEFSHLVNNRSPSGSPSNHVQPVFTVMDQSSSQRLKTLKVNNLSLTGHELRDLLNLPSTRVSWNVQGDSMVFTTHGYGHGVGLCQYGADGMAREGHSYKEILNHYYQGVEIISLKTLNNK